MDKLAAVIEKIDDMNLRDPQTEIVDGKELPHEWVDARRVTAWVERLNPEASDWLKIAARGQHVARWKIPRQDYPMDRGGYLRWRADLKIFHAATVGDIMKEAGYGAPDIDAVKAIILRRDIKSNPDAQTLEDALCLVFLEHEFDALIAKTAEAKMIEILRKTWAKMSEAGRARALKLQFSIKAKGLIEAALKS